MSNQPKTFLTPEQYPEAYARGRKFDHYRTIPSFREYLLYEKVEFEPASYTAEASGVPVSEK